MDDEYQIPRKETGVFWIEVEKIKPNPMQPRKEFDEKKLADLSESIRQYGVLQPLIVVRKEYEVLTGRLVEYELIAGERRLQASRLAGLNQVPVIIREEPSEQVKLELALIENIQREDLNAVERAKGFKQLIDNFKLKHHEVGLKVGKSREFVTNTLRILMLPDDIQEGLSKGLITEGHTRPLLMLAEQPEHQNALYKKIIYEQITVREAERISRRVAIERRKKQEEPLDAETKIVEEKLSDALGTRVLIEKKGEKGRISIEFFSDEELGNLLGRIRSLYEKENPESSDFPEDENSNESRNGVAENFTI